MQSELTHEAAHSLLAYDPLSGILTWKSRHGAKKAAGTIAGYITDRGYIAISLMGKVYKAHRVIWLMQTGVWPTYEIDHINRNRSDNRFENLRDVPKELNMQNSKPVRANVTGWPGARVHRNKFASTIQANGKRHYLGTFDTAAQASQAYFEAKKRLHIGERK